MHAVTKMATFVDEIEGFKNFGCASNNFGTVSYGLDVASGEFEWV